MRRAYISVYLLGLAGCGRVGFDALASVDAQFDDSATLSVADCTALVAPNPDFCAQLTGTAIMKISTENSDYMPAVETAAFLRFEPVMRPPANRQRTRG